MPPTRPSNYIQRPAQRRPRAPKACTLCKKLRQRCDPSEWGTNDGPCSRCVSLNLECSLARASRSQSPISGPGVQGHESIQHHVAPSPASGSNEGPMVGPETDVQYTQHPDSARVPMGGWPAFMVQPEERPSSGANTFVPVQIVPGSVGFATLAPTMEGYRSYQNVAQGYINTELRYFPQGYATSSGAYTTGYVVQSANEGETVMGYVVEEPQPSDNGGSASEQGGSFFRSGA